MEWFRYPGFVLPFSAITLGFSGNILDYHGLSNISTSSRVYPGFSGSVFSRKRAY